MRDNRAKNKSLSTNANVERMILLNAGLKVILLDHQNNYAKN